MSIKSKDVQFDAELPTFLRRLRGQVTGASDDPDRHAGPVRLVKKQRQDDQDDAPTYVLEGSDATISKEEYDAMTRSTAARLPEQKDSTADVTPPEVPGQQDGQEAQSDPTRKTQKLADVGIGSKKRKAAKIGQDDPEEGGDVESSKPSATVLGVGKKPKKKAKAIKLSFGDDEER